MSISGTQRLVTLPPAPESARHARRFVTELLISAGGERFVETATLLTSELVTNGIVHAHTELRLVAEATSRWVRVEVVDFNPALPAKRGYDEEAFTGRGLELVELLADDFGIAPIEGGGKRVWFRLGRTAVARQPEAEPVVDTVVAPKIHLLNLPVELYCAWQQHADASLREAILASLDTDGQVVPEDFAMASEALTALAAGTADVFGRREAAAASGGPSITTMDVEVDMPAGIAPKFAMLRDVLRRCSAMSISGDLLVPPSLPEIQAVRDWVCDEVARQAAGLPAYSWELFDGEELPLGQVSATLLDDVRHAAGAAIAVDRGNRIVALSPALEQLLGWPASELTGRRLVAIIPPRLRDAHVAGFTRHLLGARGRLVGQPTVMPALHRDGREVAVRLLIERRNDPLAGLVFVATLDAVSASGK